MLITDHIRRALLAYLQDRGISATALGVELGVANSTVAKWLSKDGFAEMHNSNWVKVKPLIQRYLDAPAPAPDLRSQIVQVVREVTGRMVPAEAPTRTCGLYGLAQCRTPGFRFGDVIPDGDYAVPQVPVPPELHHVRRPPGRGPELDQVREAIRQARRDRDTLDRALLDGLITAETAGHFNAHLGGLLMELDRLQARAAVLESEQEATRVPLRTVDLQAHLGRIVKRLASPDPAKQAAAIREVLLGVERQEDGGYQLRTVLVPRGADTRQVWHPTREPSATLLPLLMA